MSSIQPDLWNLAPPAAAGEQNVPHASGAVMEKHLVELEGLVLLL